MAWLLASLGLRIYLYFFNSYSVTYGSLGAVIILLMWFYITGLMLLVGAEINSEIEAAAAERKVNQVSPAAETGCAGLAGPRYVCRRRLTPSNPPKPRISLPLKRAPRRQILQLFHFPDRHRGSI